MADLEEHVVKRDKRFVVRLVLLLAAGIVAGLVLYVKITSSSLGNCAAGTFGDMTGRGDSGVDAR
jgi:hypothetical protein